MGSNWENISLIMLCINIFIYIGSSSMGLQMIQGDPLSTYFVSDFNQDNLLNDSSASGLGVNEEVVVEPEQITAQKGGSFQDVLLLLDALELAFDFIRAIFNFLLTPFILFKIQGMPYIVALLISPPLAFAFWGSIFRLIRGA